MDWTPEQEKLIRRLIVKEHATNKRLYQEIKKTTSEVVTAGMIAGKINRLGLSGHRKPQKVVKAAEPKKAPRTKPPASVAPPKASTPSASQSIRAPAPPAKTAPSVAKMVNPAPTVTTFGTATLLTLCDGMCKWPIGDPGDEGFSFCGRVVGERLPNGKHPTYCYVHRSTARKKAA
jgi:GcrA cell cycle regulator